MTQPWLISDDGWYVVSAVYRQTDEGRAFLDQLRRERADAGLDMNGGDAHEMKIVDGVAIIQVCGPIFRKANLFSCLSDATTDSHIREQLAAAMARADVRAVVLDIDSPGGEAAGCAETSNAIRALDAVKPVVAYTGGMACSKAYWYASACRHIVAAQDAHVGSVGARRTLTDDAKAEEAEGIRTIDLVSGVSPDKRGYPVDDAVVATALRGLNDIAAVFVEHVARGRHVTPEYVIENFGRGAAVIASRAIAGSMLDEIGNLDAAIAAAQRFARVASPQRMMAMSKDTPAASAEPVASTEVAPVVASMDDGKCDGCGDSMDPQAPIYCAACAGKGSESKAAAPDASLASARAETKTLLDALGADGVNAAIGMIAALREEAAAAAAMRSQRERDQAAARNARIGAQLAACAAAGKVTLADLTATVPAFLDAANRDKAHLAVESLTEADAIDPAKVCAALSGAVSLSSAEAERLGAYLAAKQPPAMPEPRLEPERDPAGESAALVNDQISQFAARTRAAMDRNTPKARP